jgi:O-antigen ligase
MSRSLSETAAILSPNRTIVVAIVAALLVWLPVPAGSVTPTGLLTFRLGAALAALAAAACWGRGEGIERIGPTLAALGGLAVLGLVQSLPWPLALIGLVSPSHAEIVTAGREAIEAPVGAFGYLSLNPGASRGTALSLAAGAALLFAGFIAGRHRRHRRWLAAAVLAAALLEVLGGLRPWLAGSLPRLRGTWVNPDHLAVQLEIALCVGLVVVWGLARRSFRFGLDLKVLVVGLALALWLALLGGLLFTGSRAGLAATALGLTVAGAGLAADLRRRRWRLAVLAAGAIVVALVAAEVGAQSLERLLQTSPYDVVAADRALVWRESLGLVRQFPATGTGLGSFEDAYPLVQSAVATRGVWGRAHNDFLELLVTTGMVGAILGFAGLVGLARSLGRGARRGRSREDRYAAIAGLSVLAAVALHELFDFGASLPANGATLAVVVGAASAVRLRPEDEGRSAPGAGTDPRARGRSDD